MLKLGKYYVCLLTKCAEIWLLWETQQPNKKDQEKAQKKKRGRGGEARHLMGAVPQQSGVVILSKNLKSSPNRFSDNF